jgi:hypothetical protein
VRDKALPVLTAEVPDGHLSTGRPVWQDLAHALAGLAAAGQSFDANGYAVRYLAGFGEYSFSTGAVPGLGQLVGLADQKILGARPQWLGPGVAPPFRPDAPCADQPVADLSQRTGPVQVGTTRAVRGTRARATAGALRKALRAARKGARP